ncbi:MAG TPA: GDP-mannose 4,6-dehydratase [Pirellulales bacterium]|nr:GDP-mannose 4,6-dehydratase [Pirellulales bacterium]
MQRIAVLGSNSFSGSDFIDLLLESPDRQVLGISRSPEKIRLFLPYQPWSDGRFKFRQLDLNHDTDEILAELDRFQPEGIVNFAAQSEVAPSWHHPEHWFQTNVVALAKLLNPLKERRYLKKYVHISSPEVYGTCQGRVTEETPVNPSTPYAASKAAADLFLSTLFKNYHFPLVTIRATNVYGAHQQLWKIIPRSVIYLLTNRKISLDGGGTAVKSYIHIRDVSRGELLALERGQPGTMYHLSPDRGYAVRDVVERICTLLDRDFAASTITVGERLGQDAAYVIDSTRARQELGWHPQVDLDQGLRDVVSWVKQNFQEICGEPLEYRHAA